MNETAKSNWHAARKIFEEALLRPAEHRRSYAEKLCGANETLWAEVKSLLDWHEKSDSFLETPAVVQVVASDQRNDQLVAGQRLLHYEIRKLIGMGGMGEVYLAWDTRLHRNVAVKLLRQDLLPQVRTSERLLREARAAALLEHPNICHIYEVSEADGFSFIVMQYVVGTTLDEFLADGGIDSDTALDLARQIADGLAEAHSRGIVHRDIKPANIIVSDRGQAKILDFGLAKFTEAEGAADAAGRILSAGGVMGTMPYMSPEQIQGQPVDGRTDIFSFGTLLFEMMCGTSAFRRESDAETITAILTDEPDLTLVSPILRPVLEKCLSKNPAKRYFSANELVEALIEARQNEPMGKRKPPNTTFNIEAMTGFIDSETRPLYTWQSGRDNNVHPSSDLALKQPHFFSRRWLFLLAAGATIVTSVLIAAWQQLPQQGAANSSTYVPPSLRPLSEAPLEIRVENNLVAIPGGTFNMGLHNSNDDFEKPEHPESVASFRMNRTEVTNSEFAEFIYATRYKPANSDQFLAHWVDGGPAKGEELTPVRFVNLDDIKAFIGWKSQNDGVQYRLPTETEWEYAARNGDKDNLYPWGDMFQPRCAFIEQKQRPPVEVGTHSCPNVWGVEDLIGNVWEWTATPARVYRGSNYYLKPQVGEYFIARGGSASESSSSKMAITSAFRVLVASTSRKGSLGFRLVTSQ